MGEIINDLWGLFVCAAFVIGFVVGSKVTEKEERRLFDRYKCFNACKFRNDPNFILPIKIYRGTLDVTNLEKDMTKGGMVEPLFPFSEETKHVSDEGWNILYPTLRGDQVKTAFPKNMTYEQFKKDIGL